MALGDPTYDLDQFRALLHARHALVRIVTTEENEAVNLVRDAARGARRTALIWTVISGLRMSDLKSGQNIPDTEHPAGALVALTQRYEPEQIAVFLDLSPHLSDSRTMRALREAVAHFREINSTIILIDHEEHTSDYVHALATRFELSLPDEDEIEEIVRATLRRSNREKPIRIEITNRDLRLIVRNLQGLTRRHIEQITLDTVATDRTLNEDDINATLAQKRRLFHRGGVLDYVEAPVNLDDIGGLRNLKDWLKRRERSFTDDAKQYGLTPPRGVLLLGVQGAGKSLSAKAIATAWQRPLLRLDPGALYDRYVGESEQRLRSALRQAEAMAPIVLWIDEIEKGFASAASHSTDGGLSQRMFGTLLTWMQEHHAPVFLVATANNIEALPPELLRKGRFDEIFFVDLPDAEVRQLIFSIHLKKRNQDPSKFDLEALAKVSEGYSGAEIEQAVIGALHSAFHDEAELDTARVAGAIEKSPPLSVTMREKIAELRRWARDRCVPAD